VVPVVLILLLAGIATYVVIGQMAVYLVTPNWRHARQRCCGSAEALALVPVTDPATALRRFRNHDHSAFRILAADHGKARASLSVRQQDLAATRRMARPSWRHASGLIVKQEDGGERLFAWAHVIENGEEVDGAGAGDN